MSRWVYVEDYGTGVIVERVEYPDGYMWRVRLEDGRIITIHDSQIVAKG